MPQRTHIFFNLKNDVSYFFPAPARPDGFREGLANSLIPLSAQRGVCVMAAALKSRLQLNFNYKMSDEPQIAYQADSMCICVSVSLSATVLGTGVLCMCVIIGIVKQVT